MLRIIHDVIYERIFTVLSEIAAERCWFEEIPGVNMTVAKGGYTVTYYGIRENHRVGKS